MEKALFNYLLRLADSSLIIGHRLSEWCGHGPVLEEDIALTNIALDFVGRANALYEYAGKVEGKGRTEDDLAYLRNERDFFNNLLAEQPNGDYAQTILRQYLTDAFEIHFYEALSTSKDETLAGIAAKSLKEIQYHLRHSSSWMLRLGDGTEESNRRLQNALNEIYRFTGSLFETDENDSVLIAAGIVPDLSAIQQQWQKDVDAMLEKAMLKKPENVWMQKGNLQGKHTEHLGYILAEMQSLHRALPGVKW
ncbi:MAG: 1,2-phenylacetyl-CoA epoxidase, subunit C [Bacteroidia bacterium]|nr:1,2-phenylacetyl-CoA epoxidase, subunit C [Bacteroidia bacterium]